MRDKKTVKVGDMVFCDVCMDSDGDPIFIWNDETSNFSVVRTLEVEVTLVDSGSSFIDIMIPYNQDMYSEGSEWRIRWSYWRFSGGKEMSVQEIYEELSDERPDWKRWADGLASVDMPKNGNSGFEFI